MNNMKEFDANIDRLVMERLRAPFGCEKVGNRTGYRWRIHDANGDVLAFCAPAEEGYARLIVQALNEHFERRKIDPQSRAPMLQPDQECK